MKNVITRDFRVQRAQHLAQTISEGNYYAFLGDHLANAADNVASEIVDSDRLITDIFSNMLFGKQIAAGDVAVMIARKAWVSGTIYDKYSNSSVLTCHVVVETGSTYNVYKCLDNAKKGPSTVQPSGTPATAFSTADGYLWKYMFGIPIATYDKFKTTSYIPYVANNSVISSAIPGSIDVIDVIAGGVGYNNYFIGEFRATDLPATTGSSLIYGLNETASNINDFYNGCIIKITDPASPIVGQYRTIVDYIVSGPTKRVTLDSAFTASAAAADGYEIYPGVTVTSTGEAASPCIGWALVNSMQANTVQSIEIFSPGANHRSSTAVVNAHSSVGVTSVASLSPIISPAAGHGAAPLQELGGNYVGIASSIDASDTDVPQSNDIRTIGIVNNPKFRRVAVPLDSAIGTSFVINEQVTFYQIIATIGTGVSITGQSITGTGMSLLSSLAVNDYVVIASDATNGIIAQISGISSNNAASTYATYVGTTTGTMYIVRALSNGKVTANAASSLTIEGVSNKISSEGYIIGSTSKRISAIGGPTYNTDNKTNFTKFTQAIRLVGTTGTGTLVIDEQITQGTSSAYIHSIVDNLNGTLTIYCTNQSGSIATGTITGVTSGATFNVTTKYNGDLLADQGQIVYAENMIPYNRQSHQTETIKIVLEL